MPIAEASGAVETGYLKVFDCSGARVVAEVQSHRREREAWVDRIRISEVVLRVRTSSGKNSMEWNAEKSLKKLGWRGRIP